MENIEVIGRWLVIIGVAVALVGGIIWWLSRVLGFTRLPGSLRLETSGVTCVIPILASIVLSILLTIVLNLLVRWFNR